MKFRNNAHRTAFTEAIKDLRRSDYAELAAVYSLTAAMGSLRLLQHISRIIQDRLEDERRGKGGIHIDRKLKRIINEKKEAHGLKQG